MTVLARFADNRLLVRATLTTVTLGAGAVGGAAYSSATISDLRLVEQVVGYDFTTTTVAAVVGQDAVITQNVVGLSIYSSVGNTVMGYILVTGF